MTRARRRLLLAAAVLLVALGAAVAVTRSMPGDGPPEELWWRAVPVAGPATGGRPYVRLTDLLDGPDGRVVGAGFEGWDGDGHRIFVGRVKPSTLRTWLSRLGLRTPVTTWRGAYDDEPTDALGPRPQGYVRMVLHHGECP